MPDVRSLFRRLGAVALAAAVLPAAIGVTSASANPNGITVVTNKGCRYVDRPAGSVPTVYKGSALMCALNRARKANGTPPLRYQHNLYRAALLHANRSRTLKWWDRNNGAVSHIDPQTGSDPVARDLAAKYCAFGTSYAMSEITYSGGGGTAGSPTAAVDWWLNDPPHRAALLNPPGLNVGPGMAVGSAFNPPDPDPAGTFVVDFGTCTGPTT